MHRLVFRLVRRPALVALPAALAAACFAGCSDPVAGERARTGLPAGPGSPTAITPPAGRGPAPHEAPARPPVGASPSDAPPTDAPAYGAPPTAPPAAVPVGEARAAAAPPDVELPEQPTTIELVALNAEQTRLLYVTDPTLLPEPRHPGDPALWNLWSLDLGTGASTLVDTRVVRGIDGGSTLEWSDDGRTVVYGRVDEALDDPAHPDRWKVHIYCELHAWREGQGHLMALGSAAPSPLLPPSGHRVIWRAESTYDLVIADLDAPNTAPQGLGDTWKVVWHRPSDTLVRRTDDKRILVYHGDAAAPLELAEAGGTLLGLDGRFIVYTEEGVLSAYDVEDRVAHHSALVTGATGSVFFDLDAEQGLAVAGVSDGSVYGDMLMWDLADGAGFQVPLPVPTEAGGHALATFARIHEQGVAYHAQAGWLDHDLWELRDGEHHHVVKNHCTEVPLEALGLRLVVAADTSCAASKRVLTAYLYDEESLQLTDTGITGLKYLRAVLSGGRFTVDRDAGTGARELVLWEPGAATVTPLALETSFHDHVRRDGEWYVATYPYQGGDASSSLVVLHPGGVAHVPLGAPLGSLLVGEDLVALVLREPPADRLVVTSLDALVAGEPGP